MQLRAKWLCQITSYRGTWRLAAPAVEGERQRAACWWRNVVVLSLSRPPSAAAARRAFLLLLSSEHERALPGYGLVDLRGKQKCGGARDFAAPAAGCGGKSPTEAAAPELFRGRLLRPPPCRGSSVRQAILVMWHIHEHAASLMCADAFVCRSQLSTRRRACATDSEE